jgi:hypothetical protein
MDLFRAKSMKHFASAHKNIAMVAKIKVAPAADICDPDIL